MRGGVLASGLVCTTSMSWWPGDSWCGECCLGLHGAVSDASRVISFDTEDRVDRALLWSVVRMVLFFASMIITRQWGGLDWQMRQMLLLWWEEVASCVLALSTKLILSQGESRKTPIRAGHKLTLDDGTV